MNVKALIVTVIALSSLNACSIMSQNECQTANWSGLGYIDGSQGTSSSQFAERSNVCAKYGVRSNFAEYETGYKQGLATYCTESHGFFVGSNGNTYQGICPQNRAPLFLKGYYHGQHIFKLNSEISQIQTDLQNEQYDIENRQSTLDSLKNKLIYGNLTPEHRANILAEMDSINKKPNKIKEKKETLHKLQLKLKALQKKYQ